MDQRAILFQFDICLNYHNNDKCTREIINTFGKLCRKETVLFDCLDRANQTRIGYNCHNLYQEEKEIAYTQFYDDHVLQLGGVQKETYLLRQDNIK